MTADSPIWAAAACLSIHCGPMTMMPITSLKGAAELADCAHEQFHSNDYQAFSSGWSNGTPDERRSRYERWLRWSLATAKPADATIVFGAAVNGLTVGSTSIEFVSNQDGTRTVRTGSWLRQIHQGLGYGTIMRQCVLAFAFDELSASTAFSEAFSDNLPSIAINRSAGYSIMGSTTVETMEGTKQLLKFALKKYQWSSNAKRKRVEIQEASYIVRALTGIYDRK